LADDPNVNRPINTALMSIVNGVRVIKFIVIR